MWYDCPSCDDEGVAVCEHCMCEVCNERHLGDPCDVCKDTGKVKCDECDGEGGAEDTCSACNGAADREFPCYKCGTKGTDGDPFESLR